ncbi:MAG: hypothetical protein LBV74_03315 [Tannerella sp.]|nr:hypothetical protein [Tannerella sp.]
MEENFRPLVGLALALSCKDITFSGINNAGRILMAIKELFSEERKYQEFEGLCAALKPAIKQFLLQS